MTPRSHPRFPDISAVILAGGRATRMNGAAKAFLDLGGEAILDRQVAVLRPRFSEILVAVGSLAEPAGAARDPFLARRLRPVEDLHPGAGPLGGLHAALRACATPWLFAVACDMPFLDGDLIDRMSALALASGDRDALVPVPGGRPEPLHALYGASIAPVAEACLVSGRRALSDLLSGVNVRLVDDRDLPGLDQSYTWTNLNTPEDLEAAAQAIGRLAAGTGTGRG